MPNAARMTRRHSNLLSMRRKIVVFAVVILLPAAAVCADVLRLATTTSTDNSGLIAHLLPNFEQSDSATVHTIAVGTGRALSHAKNGDVDIVLVHAREAELELIAQGYAVNRHEVMYNEFVVVGPAGDPAGIHGSSSLSEAFKKIYQTRSAFVSRGDDSGTHKKELRLWQQSGVSPDRDWYRDVGQGMGRTLQIADELGAYALTDKATWLFMRDQLSLPIHVEGSQDGRNVYGVMAVNPELHPHVNSELAAKFIDWLTSDEVKRLISLYEVNGEQLFYPLD